jgi:hypothetical protein
MLHFTCDLCGKSLGAERFVVRVEVRPGFDPAELVETDLDADHLEEIAASIESMESTGDFKLDDCGVRSFRYDLCPACRERYSKDPLGQHAARRLDFSSN